MQSGCVRPLVSASYKAAAPRVHVDNRAWWREKPYFLNPTAMPLFTQQLPMLITAAEGDMLLRACDMVIAVSVIANIKSKHHFVILKIALQEIALHFSLLSLIHRCQK